MGLAKPFVDEADGNDMADEHGEPSARPEELRLIEALLFAAGEPLDDKTLKARLPEGVDIASAMRSLQTEYASRGVNLVRVASEALGGKGGGGRPDMAQAGGPDGSKADAALKAIETALGA